MKRLLAASLVLLWAALWAADESTIAGRWNIHSSIMGNESDQECTFVVKGDALTGTCSAPQGSADVAGKVRGNSVSWQRKTQYDGQDLTIVYTGKIDSGGKLTGSIEVQPFGVEGEFTAARVK